MCDFFLGELLVQNLEMKFFSMKCVALFWLFVSCFFYVLNLSTFFVFHAFFTLFTLFLSFFAFYEFYYFFAFFNFLRIFELFTPLFAFFGLINMMNLAESMHFRSMNRILNRQMCTDCIQMLFYKCSFIQPFNFPQTNG